MTDQRNKIAKDLDLTAIDFLNQAIYFSDTCRFKRMWAYKVFKDQFGEWSKKELRPHEPQLPCAEFLNWVMTLGHNYKDHVERHAEFTDVLMFTQILEAKEKAPSQHLH